MKVFMEFTVEEFNQLQDFVYEGMTQEEINEEPSLVLKFGFTGDLVAHNLIRSRVRDGKPPADVIFTDRMLEALR
jgi:hypothetical protein